MVIANYTWRFTLSIESSPFFFFHFLCILFKIKCCRRHLRAQANSDSHKGAIARASNHNISHLESFHSEVHRDATKMSHYFLIRNVCSVSLNRVCGIQFLYLRNSAIFLIH